MLITSLIFADIVEFWNESKEEIVDDIEISPPHLEQCNDMSSAMTYKIKICLSW